MSFGILEAIGMVGNVAQLLNPNQSTAQAQPAQLDREQFMSLFNEAMNKYKSQSSEESEDLEEKLPEIFALLDTNKDGTLSKSEFEQLAPMLDFMRTQANLA